MGLVKDASVDLQITVKFEPKNKFVLKELRKLEEDYVIEKQWCKHVKNLCRNGP